MSKLTVDISNGTSFTSGRYVYRTAKKQWIWQCDMHDISVAAWHTFPTMLGAFENALIHASECPYVASRNRSKR